MLGVDAERQEVMEQEYARVREALLRLGQVEGVSSTSDYRLAYELCRRGVLSDRLFKAFESFRSAYLAARLPGVSDTDVLLRFGRLAEKLTVEIQAIRRPAA